MVPLFRSVILMLSDHLLVERCEKINAIVAASFNTGITLKTA
jgi:hypothetical protein